MKARVVKLQLRSPVAVTLAILVGGCHTGLAAEPAAPPTVAPPPSTPAPPSQAAPPAPAEPRPTPVTPPSDASEGCTRLPSPLVPAVGTALTAEELAASDQWADQAGLRASPLRWSLMAIPAEPGVATSAAVVFQPKESPTSATVTITEDGYLDDSVRGRRYVLEFKRARCETCTPAGVAPWALASVLTTHRCWQGRGHEAYSADPCR